MKERVIIAVGLVTLALFSILPALRVQLFETNYDTYYSSRLVLFMLLGAAFISASKAFNRSLALGDTSAVRTGYGDPLLTLRAMACAIVLVGHGASISFPPADIAHQASQSRVFWLLLPMPWAGVWIFFTLSGYLMGKGFFTGRYAFSKDGILRFYRNRYLRLAPLAYFAIAIIVLFEHPEALSTLYLKHLIALLLFDYDGTSPLSLIGLLWSIATEMQFYLTAPFMAAGIYFAGRRFGIFPVIAALLVFGTAYRIGFYLKYPPHWMTSVYTPLLGNLDLFGLGMATSFIVQTHPLRWPRLVHAVICLVLIWAACALAWSRLIASPASIQSFLQFGSPPLFGLATAFVIVVMEHAARFERQPANSLKWAIRSTQIFGILTYAIYIWHAPIFTAYAKTLAQPVTSRDTMAALSIASVLVLAFSWVTYLAIEKPVDELKKSGDPLLRRRREAIADQT